MMEVSIEKLNDLERRLTITVPVEDIEPKVAKRMQEVAKKANLKGFRPGKVPIALVQQYFGDSVRGEVIEQVVPEVLDTVVKQEKLDMAGLLKIEAKEPPKATSPYKFDAIVEVFPEIKLQDFNKITVEKPEVTITPDDIDHIIDEMRATHADEMEVDRVAANGDVVLIDFKGLVDGEPFQGGSHNDYKLELGSKSFIAGFEDGLVGAKAGETKVLNLVFPKDYQEAKLADKAVTFSVTVKKVLNRKLPEINDAFAKKAGVKAGTVIALREDVTKNMQQQLKSAIEGRVKDQIISQLLESYDFAVPKSLVAREVDAFKKQMIQQYAHMRDVEKLVNNFPMEGMTAESSRRVKLGLLFNAIITEHDLKPDDAQVNAEIEAMASEYEDPQHFIKLHANDKQRRAQVETYVAEKQVVEKILETAKVNKKTMSYRDAVKPLTPAANAAAQSERSAKEDVVE